MSLLGIIPARGGSKGIYRKNIKRLAGKPLIGWTIECSKKSKCIDKLIVSTDDEEIAKIANQYGADVPFLRPKELSQDNTPGLLPVIHAIEMLPNFDWVIVLQPTSPLRTSQDIDGIWDFCILNQGLSAVSVCKVKKHPYWNYNINQSKKLEPLFKNQKVYSSRQELPKLYAPNGCLYLANCKWLKKQKSLIGFETLGYIMHEDRSLDIDTPFDWLMAEFMMEKINE